MNIKKHSDQRGFTLIELLIATTVFSVILLVAAATLIQVGRMYYKGVISSRTQGTARTAMDEISRELQFSGGNVVTLQSDANAQLKKTVTCYNDTRLTYVLNAQLSDEASEGQIPSDQNQHRIKHVLWQDKIQDIGNCSLATSPDLTVSNPGGVEGKELLEENMRLTNLQVCRVEAATNDDCNNEQDSVSDAYKVAITVIYGDDDLLIPNATSPTGCKGTPFGGQWCAISRLSTQVYRRVQ